MAAENLTVEHKKIETAGFDTEKRILYLPIFEEMGADLYDLLIGHEIGHALYTPNEGWETILNEKAKAFKSYINVTEDARIEKLVKRKFAGMKRVFYAGYVDLVKRDFFGINKMSVDEINGLPFIDKFNLWFKVGSQFQLSFNEKEQNFITRGENLETWEDAMKLAEDLFEHQKEENSKLPEENEPGGENEEGKAGEGENTESGEPSENEGEESGEGKGEGEECENDGEGKGEESSEEENKDEGGKKSSTQGSKGSDTSSDNEPEESITQKNFNDSSKKLIDDEAKTNTYIELPTKGINVKNIITPYKEVHANINKYISGFDLSDESTLNNWSKIQSDFIAFKKDMVPSVNYMVKEFEMRKAADAHKRQSTSKTGVINTNSLHSYKYNDDIFKKITSVRDGKNHGLVMFVDWSGSMSNNLLGTVKQLLTLVSFCKQVNIPFEVYSFSNASGAINSLEEKTMIDPEIKIDVNTLKFNNLNLRQYFSNSMNSREFNEGLKNAFYMGSLSRGYFYSNGLGVPKEELLGGTPLNECIFAATEVFEDFKNKNGLQIVNTVFLTDGEGSQTHYITPDDEEGSYGSFLPNTGWNDGDTIIRDPKTRKEYIYKTKNHSYSRGCDFVKDTLLRILADRYNANVIGFFLAEERDLQYKSEKFWDVANIDFYDRKRMMKQKIKNLKKDGYSIADKKGGYSEFFIIAGGQLDDDVEFEVAEDASKVAIRNAFKKFNNKKRTSKVFLNRFVELIAA